VTSDVVEILGEMLARIWMRPPALERPSPPPSRRANAFSFKARLGSDRRPRSAAERPTREEVFMKVAAAVFVVFIPTLALAQNNLDEKGVRQAALDYVTAVYESKPDLIERSVARDLTKHGFMRQKDGTYRRGRMSYDDLVQVAKEWNADGKRDTSIKEVQVLHVMDHTAAALVVASWGVDYMQLAKLDGTWKILNIVWQTHPPRQTQ
jgi:hypothetical protein